MVARAIGVDIRVKIINLLENEQLMKLLKCLFLYINTCKEV
jgi:hypothetical protein